MDLALFNAYMPYDPLLIDPFYLYNDTPLSYRRRRYPSPRRRRRSSSYRRRSRSRR